jgi:hypothetical protein
MAMSANIHHVTGLTARTYKNARIGWLDITITTTDGEFEFALHPADTKGWDLLRDVERALVDVGANAEEEASS